MNEKLKIIDLTAYSAIIINISGGKDSQTILGEIWELARQQNYSGQIMAVHADTGAEWPQSLPHCEMLCKHYGIPFQVALPFRALPAHIERRCIIQAAKGKPGWPDMQNRYCTAHCKVAAIEKTIRSEYPAKALPGWPDMQNRYCTSDCKRAPIQKVIRAEFPAKLEDAKTILNITGERRQESPGRSKLDYLASDKDLTAGTRTVTKYRPILDYTTDDVWEHIAASGLARHVAYDLGNERLSCAICVLATDADIRRGAEARPDLAEHYLRIERETGFTFKHKKSLADILQVRQGK